MTEPIRPDDLARSKSGRIPQWVVDEAKGITVEPVPFRAHTTPPGRGGDSRGRRRLRAVLTAVGVSGLVALGLGTEVGRGLIGADRVDAGPIADRPAIGHEEQGRPLGRPGPLPIASSSYEFLQTQRDGTTPVTWSPCRPVHYVVRPDHAPPGADQLIADAFERLSTATGFRFVHDGPTDEKPSTNRPPFQRERYGDRWAPVLVYWGTRAEEPDFAGKVAGKAGPASVRTRSGDIAHVSGTVALDPVKLAGLATARGAAPARATVLHELGHLMGLGHVDDRAELMAAEGSFRITTYQPGDLAGLARLASGPCQPDV